MNRRVFWKILIGFWITSLLMSQGVWLMFVLLRPAPEPDGMDWASFASSAATAMLERDGGPRLQDEIRKWPNYWRTQVEIAPAAAGTPGAVKSEDGKSYKVIVHPRPPRHGHDRGPFDPPWEVVLASAIGGLAFSAILAAYLTAPVARLRAGFRRLAQGNFDARLGPSVGRRRDEIADLAHDFDAMAARLQELVTHRDRLLAGVSHELRSPLARLQLAIGLAQKYPERTEASLQRISQEAGKLDDMVDELLILSRLESGVETEDDYFDLAQVVREIAEDASFEGTARGILVDCDIQTEDDDDTLVSGNGKLIARAIENIVRNALRFSSEGQTVRIALNRQHNAYTVTVRDQGRGVPEHQLEAVFKPFMQSAGGDGEGFGLGLAIAQRAIRAHHGTISARNMAEGGFEIRVALPAATTELVPL